MTGHIPEITANDAWLQTIEAIIRYGNAVAPPHSTGSAGRVSFEVLNHVMHFNMAYPIVTLKPNTSWLYMCAEALWVIEGSNKLKYNTEIDRIQRNYSDDGEILAGAYGPHFKQQKDWIIQKLNEDRNTRQAVMLIWKRKPKPSRDIPCTCMLQFVIRDNKLHVLVTMRSSDVGIGLPYDMLTFTCMAAEIASSLQESTELGYCYITAGSRHIYENQMSQLSELYKENAGYWSKPEHQPWLTWKWPAIKDIMKNIIDMKYEDRAHAQSIARDLLIRAAGDL